MRTVTSIQLSYFYIVFNRFCFSTTRALLAIYLHYPYFVRSFYKLILIRAVFVGDTNTIPFRIRLYPFVYLT